MGEPIADFSGDFSGGQNASQIPARLSPQEYSSGINVSAHNGALSPRFSFEEKILNFSIKEPFHLNSSATRSYESIYYGGRFQASIPYSIGSDFYKIIVVSGVLFLVNQETFEVTLIKIKDGSAINENHPRVNWSAAGRFLVIFDFPAYPVIIEGFTARRADPSKMEVPVSVLGTYNQNRLIIANLGNEFTASDPAVYGFPNGPISFTEILTPTSDYIGQVFQLSTNFNNDPITGMGFLQVTDTSTGIGPLLVSTQNAIFSYHTELPRSRWQGVGAPNIFGSLYVAGVGAAGPRAFCNVNSDMFFISNDGQIRSASMSRNEQGKWATTPVSLEVSNFIGTPDPDLISFSVIGYFRNKVLATVNPYRTECTSTDLKPQFDIAFGGLVVLELDNVSTLGHDSPPVWAGLWTGIRPMDIQVNNGRCFIMAKDGGRNTLYEVKPDRHYDVVGPERKIRKIRSKVYTREYGFSSYSQLGVQSTASFSNKTLNSIDLHLYNIKGDFKIKVKYRPSHSRSYLNWKEFIHTAPWRSCNMPQGCEWHGLAGHQFRELNLGSPVESGCDPVTREYYDTFRRVQLLLEIEGIYWELHELRISAMTMPQNETENICDPFPVVSICSECNTDWEIPDICHETQVT